MNLNRHQRRAMDATNRARFDHDELRPIPPEAWPNPAPRGLVQVWASRDFLAQVYTEDGATRISICRTRLDGDNKWKDGITWEDLQRIKCGIGLGDFAAYEVYPADDDVVNVANMRHLWIPAVPINLGWRKAHA